jgi:hypothetical protein
VVINIMPPWSACSNVARSAVTQYSREENRITICPRRSVNAESIRVGDKSGMRRFSPIAGLEITLPANHVIGRKMPGFWPGICVLGLSADQFVKW